MGGLKLFVWLNGLFYVVYGLFGAFRPAMMSDTMGWTPSLLGLHEVRAIWMAVAALGVILLWTLRHAADLSAVVKAIMVVTAAFFIGRALGLILDGAGPQLTYMEMGLEVFVILFGLTVLKRAKA